MDPLKSPCKRESDSKPELLDKSEFCRWLDEGYNNAIEIIEEFREETEIQELKKLLRACADLTYNYWKKAKGKLKEGPPVELAAILYQNHKFCADQIGRIEKILRLNDMSKKKPEHALCWTIIADLHRSILITADDTDCRIFHGEEASKAFKIASEKAEDLDDGPVRFIFDMCFAKFKFELLEEKEEARNMLKSDLDKIKENRLEFAPEDEWIPEGLNRMLGKFNEK